MYEVVRTFLNCQSANTQRAYKTVWNDWTQHMKAEETSSGAKILAQARQYDAMRYVEELGKRKGQASRNGGHERVGAATIKHRISTLKSIYEVARREQLVEINPFDCQAFAKILHDKTQKRPTEMLEFSHVSRLCNAPDAGSKEGIRDRAVLALLFGGALRRSEVRNIRTGDVKARGKSVSVNLRDTKNGTDALQALPDWAGVAVKALYDQRVKESGGVTEYLVTEYFTLFQTSSGRIMGEKQIYRIFCSWRDHCGLPKHITPHSARATAITKLLELGIPHRDVAKFSRHASVQTVEKYDKMINVVGNTIAKKVRY